MQNSLKLTHPDKDALVEEDGRTYTYAKVDENIRQFAHGILAERSKSDLSEERIAFLIPASVEYVIVLHGIWRAGGIAVPLHIASAEAELEHCLTSVGITRLFVDSESKMEQMKSLCDRFSIEVKTVRHFFSQSGGDDGGDREWSKVELPFISPDRRAMILFTSGTTGKPKGVVSTHNTINAQITTLVTAWEWQENDVIPLFLPLHHIHGIVNILSCALWSGATIHLMPKFNLNTLCAKVAAKIFTVFMAVPTVYVKIIDYLYDMDEDDSDKEKDIRAGFGAMRLNVSGSAACPVELFEKWKQLTGQTLLERYGMTEIGMALSNPYNGERRAGHVGQALPGVTVILCDEGHQIVREESTPGEICVKGTNVFLEYWNNPDATSKSFRDGWFCTGDVAVMEDGYYRILGRSSVDIIKSGGYKLSALEIEGILLAHPNIPEVAVVGVQDRVWGEAVAAAVVLVDRNELELDELKGWCQDKMSKYKIPKRLVIVGSLPRSAMGKVNKPKLRDLFA